MHSFRSTSRKLYCWYFCYFHLIAIYRNDVENYLCPFVCPHDLQFIVFYGGRHHGSSFAAPPWAWSCALFVCLDYMWMKTPFKYSLLGRAVQINIDSLWFSLSRNCQYWTAVIYSQIVTRDRDGLRKAGTGQMVTHYRNNTMFFIELYGFCLGVCVFVCVSDS